MEEIMKRLISLIMVLLIVVIFTGCATTTSEQRKEGSDLASSVGPRPFVGESSTDARGLARTNMYGY
jgi:PBP1b-binding outer membrane lipoprotein LpoB